MTDRLAELRRQHALIADHLAWLDHEIAATAPTPPSPVSVPSPLAVPAPAAQPGTPNPPIDPAAILAASAIPAPSPATSFPDVHAQAHLPLPPTDPVDIKQDVRRGCFLYFALAVLLVVLGGALLVWVSQAYNAKHPQPPRASAVPEAR